MNVFTLLTLRSDILLPLFLVPFGLIVLCAAKKKDKPEKGQLKESVNPASIAPKQAAVVQSKKEGTKKIEEPKKQVEEPKKADVVKEKEEKVEEQPKKDEKEIKQDDKKEKSKATPDEDKKVKSNKAEALVEKDKKVEEEKKEKSKSAEDKNKKSAKKEVKKEVKADAEIKPNKFQLNPKEQKIAEGKEKRGKGDYPTMDDVLSDWDSQAEKGAEKGGAGKPKDKKDKENAPSHTNKVTNLDEPEPEEEKK